MTLPSAASFDDYGGEKVDYLVEVTDPTTDRSSTEVNAAFCDTSMMSRTAVRAWVRFTGHATTPVLVAHNALWGVIDIPVITHVSTGRFLWTAPTTITDPLGDSVAVNFVEAWGLAQGSTAYIVQAEKTSPNTVTIYTFTHAGVADDLAGVSIKAFAL